MYECLGLFPPVLEMFLVFSQQLEQIELQKQEQLALLKQIEEERAHLEIQMQTCLEEAKNKKEEEERRQPVQSCSFPSADGQKKAEDEVKDCGTGCLGWGRLHVSVVFFCTNQELQLPVLNSINEGLVFISQATNQKLLY